jgi:TPP-dependent pyruvate/acetoin dehydrogenase alpha subunit
MNIKYVAQRASAYNIPGITVDGNDVLAVYDAVSAAVAHARAGEGPSLVENLTYRWRGHSKSDRNLYRTQAEITEWQQRDPITRFANALIEAEVMSSDEIEQVSQQAQDTIEAATALALEMPEPSPENLEAEVYA